MRSSGYDCQMPHFGERFKAQRERIRLTQGELSERTGVPVDILQLIEERQVLPSKIQMEQLSGCEALGLDYETLQQWKAEELKDHWQGLSSHGDVDTQWVCPYRKWDCPCCLWPYSLQCQLTDAASAKEQVSQAKPTKG